MNYLKIYCNLIRKAEKRGYTKKKAKEQGMYVEGHHTFPVSIFGKNKRIVYLTAREHYIAHALLEKICIKRYGLKHQRTHKMIWAHVMMTGKNKNKFVKEIYCNSYLYESARLRISEIKGDFHPRRNKPHLWDNAIGENHHMKREEYKKKYSERMIGENNPNYGKYGKNNPLYGRKQPKEIIEKRTNSRCKRLYNITSPAGEKYITNNLKKFCRDYFLNNSCMYGVANGKKDNYFGWKVH